MKFMMNGALTIGTRDGATIEMAEEAGEENFFLFGLTARASRQQPRLVQPVLALRKRARNPEGARPDLFGPLQSARAWIFEPLRGALLTHGDRFMHLADLTAYLKTDGRLLHLYADQDEWTRRVVINVASSGWFSSDRTIAEYAEAIWHATLCPVS